MKNHIHRNTLNRIAHGVRKSEEDPVQNKLYGTVDTTSYPRFVRITGNAGGGYYDVVEVRHHDYMNADYAPKRVSAANPGYITAVYDMNGTEDIPLGEVMPAYSVYASDGVSVTDTGYALWVVAYTAGSAGAATSDLLQSPAGRAELVDYLSGPSHPGDLVVLSNDNIGAVWGQGSKTYHYSSDSLGTTWSSGTVISGSATGNGADTRLLVVDSFPAACWSATDTDEYLQYVRADDASGTSWGTVVDVDVTASVTKTVMDMIIVDGNPAILYHVDDGATKDLWYVRAADATGSTWGTPVELAQDVTGNSYVAVVDGRPAVAYAQVTSGSTGDPTYLRASDSTGSSWGTAYNITGATVSNVLVGGLWGVGGVPLTTARNPAGSVSVFLGDDADGTGFSDWFSDLGPVITMTNAYRTDEKDGVRYFSSGAGFFIGVGGNSFPHQFNEFFENKASELALNSGQPFAVLSDGSIGWLYISTTGHLLFAKTGLYANTPFQPDVTA